MKVLGAFWFSTIGIAVIENNVGIKKAYISVISGDDEQQDTDYIIENGYPVHKDQLKSIIDLLEGK